MFSTCPFIRPICPFVRLSVTNLWTLYFENEWTDFNANWHKSSPEARNERSTSGVRKSKVKVTWGKSYVWKLGGEIILEHLSRVDRSMQWATEMLPLGGGDGVAHSFNCTPRLSDASCWRTFVVTEFVIIVN